MAWGREGCRAVGTVQTHTYGDPGTAAPLHWDLEPQREREVSTEDKGSIEEVTGTGADFVRGNR